MRFYFCPYTHRARLVAAASYIIYIYKDRRRPPAERMRASPLPRFRSTLSDFDSIAKLLWHPPPNYNPKTPMALITTHHAIFRWPVVTQNEDGTTMRVLFYLNSMRRYMRVLVFSARSKSRKTRGVELY